MAILTIVLKVLLIILLGLSDVFLLEIVLVVLRFLIVTIVIYEFNNTWLDHDVIDAIFALFNLLLLGHVIIIMVLQVTSISIFLLIFDELTRLVLILMVVMLRLVF